MVRVERSEVENPPRLCVQIYDTDKDKVRQHVVTPQIAGHGDSYIFSGDLTADMKLSLKMKDAGAYGFFQVKEDLEGNILEITEPFPEETYPWNLEELIDILEAGDDWECPFHQIGVRHDGYTLLYRFLFLGDSSILDVEQGTCRFDSRER